MLILRPKPLTKNKIYNDAHNFLIASSVILSSLEAINLFLLEVKSKIKVDVNIRAEENSQR